jgi:hypothetical protein
MRKSKFLVDVVSLFLPIKGCTNQTRMRLWWRQQRYAL